MGSWVQVELRGLVWADDFDEDECNFETVQHKIDEAFPGNTLSFSAQYPPEHDASVPECPCGLPASQGVHNLGDDGDPQHEPLCFNCYREWMEEIDG